MKTQQITSRFDGRVLYEYEANSVSGALQEAVKSCAYLDDANLAGANLARAYLVRANLADANLAGAKINWQSHDMIAEILRCAAGDNVQRRSVAGLVLVSRDWCWDQFLTIEHSELEWALAELRKWVQDSDDAPEVLWSVRRGIST